MIIFMECNGIYYEEIPQYWNIKVPTLEFTIHLNRLLKSLTKDQVVNLTVFSMEEPVEQQAGIVYRDLKEVKDIYNTENELDDILITFKDGIISLKSILKDVPKHFVFYNLESLEDFSIWDSSSCGYEAVFLTLFLPNSIRRIRFTKEVLSDE